MLSLQLFIFAVFLLQILLMLFQFVLKKADQIFTASHIISLVAGLLNIAVCIVRHLSRLSEIMILLGLSFQHFDVNFEPLYHFLAEMGPFSEFFFNLFVNVDVSL